MMILIIIPILLVLWILLYILRSKENKVSVIAFSIVGLLLVTGILIPFISLADNNDDEVIPFWQYDDYKIIDDIDYVSGSLEIVDGYVHAKNVGRGTIVYNDGTVENVYVNRAILDVYLILGQSNGAYYNESRYNPELASPIPPRGTAYYYGSPELPVYSENEDLDGYDMYSMTNDDGTAHIGNIECPFAGQYYDNTGHKVYVINGAWSGASILHFVPPDGKVYQASQTIFKSAIECIDTNLYDFDVKSVIWVQGESDSYISIETYKIRFKSVYDALVEHNSPFKFSNYKFENILIVKTRAVNGINSSIAQEELSNELPDVYIATSITDSFTIENGLMNSDNLHYSQLGDNLIGIDVANFIFYEVYR